MAILWLKHHTPCLDTEAGCLAHELANIENQQR